MAGKVGITPSKNSFNILLFPPAKIVNAFQLPPLSYYNVPFTVSRRNERFIE